MCARRKANDMAADASNIGAIGREIKCEEIKNALGAEEEAEEAEPKRKRKSVAGNRTGEELERYKQALRMWRKRLMPLPDPKRLSTSNHWMIWILYGHSEFTGGKRCSTSCCNSIQCPSCPGLL